MNERIRQLADQILPNEKEFHQGDPKDYGYFFSGGELEKFAELIVRECGYYADVFSALECPVDMDPTETKPSDYIKREMGIPE